MNLAPFRLIELRRSTFPLLFLVIFASQQVRAESPTVLIGERMPAPKSVDPDELHYPFGIEFDNDGSMIIAEYAGARVLRRSPSGELALLAGIGKPGYSGDGGPATEATFQDIHNLAVAPDGTIYLSDHQNHAVRKIDPSSGEISTFAGTRKAGFGGDGGSAGQATFHQVMCVSLTPDNEHLLVTDLRNRRIRSINLKNNIVSTIAGNGKKAVPRDGRIATESPLVDPRAAIMDAGGNLYIVERGGHALRRVNPSGKIETIAGTGKPGLKDGNALDAKMNGPKHLAIDSRGNVYIADDNNHRIRKYDPTTKTLTTILGDDEFKLNRPHGVTVHNGSLYVADSWNHRIAMMPLP